MKDKLNFEFSQDAPSGSNTSTDGGPQKNKGLERIEDKFKDAMKVLHIQNKMIDSFLSFFDKNSYL